MAFSREDIAAIVAEVLKKTEDAKRNNIPRRILDEKFFRRVEKFGGGEKDWKDWCFQFKAAVRGASRVGIEIMRWVERTDSEQTGEDIDTQFVDEESVDQIGGELYDILCSITSGEALTLVRTVTEMNGFVAWKALCKRFGPVTPARALAAMMEVMNPVKVTDVFLIPKAIDAWTTKVVTLEKEFEEKLSDRMKQAIMLSMVPADLQDTMYQHADSMKTFEQARDRLKGLVSNRVARSQPTPMDVGRVGGDGGDHGCWEGYEVNLSGKAGGKGACHACGQQGHFARECPHKGKGKGKGYRGTCWTCGEEGHPARECPWGWKGAKGWKGKGDQKGKGFKGKGKGWGGKGVWSVEDDDHELEWEWDKADDGGDDAGRIGAIDYSGRDFAQEEANDSGGWKVVQRRGRWARLTGVKSEGVIGCIDRGDKVMEVNQLSHGWERIRVQVDSGAIDTVAPKDVARGFSLRETPMSKNKVGFVAANGSKIENYGERTVVGYTDDGEGVSMRMTCADVQKVLGSVHRMNLGGNRVMLDGKESYLESRKTGKRTRIHYENGQYVLYLWAPAVGGDVAKVENNVVATGNRYAILAADGPSGFARPARV